MLLGTAVANAVAVSNKGQFAIDNDKAVFSLDVLSTAGGTISARTLSYSGGVNAQNETVASGGFAPVLTLFDNSTGIEVFRDVGASHACSVASASFCWDADLHVTVTTAGNYALVLTQDDNLPLGALADGFSHDNEPNYTGAYLNAPNGTFIQIDGTQRTGLWALDVEVVNAVSAVPEPSSLAMYAAALGLSLLTRRRKAA